MNIKIVIRGFGSPTEIFRCGTSERAQKEIDDFERGWIIKEAKEYGFIAKCPYTSSLLIVDETKESSKLDWSGTGITPDIKGASKEEFDAFMASFKPYVMPEEDMEKLKMDDKKQEESRKWQEMEEVGIKVVSLLIVVAILHINHIF